MFSLRSHLYTSWIYDKHDVFSETMMFGLCLDWSSGQATSKLVILEAGRLSLLTDIQDFERVCRSSFVIDKAFL
jgi:hypothetical protein